MNPAGYMAKRVGKPPGWTGVDNVCDVFSVSDHVNDDFADYIPQWKHNGYWLFDSPELIRSVANENHTALGDTRLFYYEVYEFELDGKDWKAFAPEPSFGTNVSIPKQKHLEGFDVVTFSAHTSPECSPLSCNHLAKEIQTNSHCLLHSLDEAKNRLESGAFDNSEPGPYRIFAVYSVDWPE
jgi:hypothetical protein